MVDRTKNEKHFSIHYLCCVRAIFSPVSYVSVYIMVLERPGYLDCMDSSQRNMLFDESSYTRIC